MALYLDYTGLSYYDNKVKVWVTDRLKNLTGSTAVNNVAHATKADQDGNGAVIADTYETKADAQAHAQTAEATYQKATDITLATTEDINALFA